MHALVTGCAGFIGSHLTDSLLRDGHEVVGVDCFNDNYGRREKRRNLEHAQEWSEFDFVPLDLSRGDLVELVDECDVVFHLAAEPGVRSSWGPRFESYQRNNVAATQQLLEAAKHDPQKRFVYASSSSIYGQAEALPTPEDTIPRPFSPYGVTKLAAEHLCDAYHGNYGVDVVSLRYFSVYGPRQRPDMAFNVFCHAALQGRPLTPVRRRKPDARLHVRRRCRRCDARGGRAPDLAGRVYNIGGGSRVSVNEALELLEHSPAARWRCVRSPGQRGDVRDTGADTTAARAGCSATRPPTPFEDGLRARVGVGDGVSRDASWHDG